MGPSVEYFVNGLELGKILTKETWYLCNIKHFQMDQEKNYQ